MFLNIYFFYPRIKKVIFIISTSQNNFNKRLFSSTELFTVYKLICRIKKRILSDL